MSSTIWDWLLEWIWNFWPFFMVPFLILINETTPRYESNHESTIKACNWALGSPSGLGMSDTSLSNRVSTPSPVFALTKGASNALIPTISSISDLTRSGSAWGRSILLIIGSTSNPSSTAV